MNIRKSILAFILMALVCLTGSVTPSVTVEAAKLTNVLKAPTAASGKWVNTDSGKRYCYTNSGNYAKNKWLRIGGQIYYFNSNGYVKKGLLHYNKRIYLLGSTTGKLQVGWKTYNDKKYYFWKSSSKGELAGSAAVGFVKLSGKMYYFNSNGVMQTGWTKVGNYYYYFNTTSGQMAVSTTVGTYKVDQYGRRVVGNMKQNSTSSVDIWVGDSRTVGLGQTMGISSKCIASVGQGYSWYVSTAEAKLKSKLKSKPASTVVINFGVNDIDNISKYISKYRKLIKDYPKAKIYFMSVNPIDSKYTYGYVSNSAIQSFNSKLKAAFPTRYIDTYTYLKNNGFSTVDGLHYTSATYKIIYQYAVSMVG